MTWLIVGVAFLILFMVIVISNFVLRKIFKIEKEKKDFFSYGHVNKLHEKVDRFYRNGSLLILLIFFYLFIFESLSISILLSVMILTFIVDYSIMIFFQWRYSQNPKQAILTVNNMVWMLISAIAVFWYAAS